MRYFPIFLDIQDRSIIVVGGGEPAAAKVRLLMKAGARITIVAPALHAELATLAASGALAWRRKRFAARDLDGARIAYAATGLAEIDAAVSRAGRARGVPVNAVDRPELCDFITPAIIDRDPVIVAVGTEGAAPVLARDIKAHLDAWLPARIGAFARFAQSLRARVAAAITGEESRRRFWDGVFKGPVREAYLAGDAAGATAIANALIARHGEPATGFVWLVGAGPGDPELMTLKAQRVLQEADVIVADRLANPQILDYARRDARRIMVGKTPGQPSPSQEDINAILVAEARAGRIVARLKGGDPFIFGRGGEELAVLEAAGIPSAVIPGITAAMGCAASTRLPLSTRGINRSVTLLTAASAGGPAEHDWPALARSGQAFAVYMGVGAARHLEHGLKAAGMAPSAPVVIVENGTLPSERVIETQANAIQAAISAFGVRGPAIIYVGLHWAEAGIGRPGHVRVFPDDGSVVALPRPRPGTVTRRISGERRPTGRRPGGLRS